MDIKYEFEPAYTLLTVNLEPGESIKVEPGAMVAQSADISVSTGSASSGGKPVPARRARVAPCRARCSGLPTG